MVTNNVISNLLSFSQNYVVELGEKTRIKEKHLDVRNVFTPRSNARHTFYVNRTTDKTTMDKRNSSYRPMSFFYPSLTVKP